MAKKARKEFSPFKWTKNASGAAKQKIKTLGVTNSLNAQTSVKPTQDFVAEAKEHRKSLFKKK